jgi:hypothetical protein
MPEFEGVEGFPAPDDDLPRLPLETWGLLFTSLDPGLRGEEGKGPGTGEGGPVRIQEEEENALRIPFDAWIDPVRERVGFLPWEAFRFEADVAGLPHRGELDPLRGQLPGGVPHPVRARREPDRGAGLRGVPDRALSLGEPPARGGEG